MRWWLPPAIIGGLVLAVIVAGVAVLSTQDINDYKDEIAARVSKSTGRQLTLNGDFKLSIGFSPSIVAEDVTFENASWGSRPQMLKLGRLEAKVALFPMLMGRIEIQRLHLIDADLIIETDANGVGNWKFKKKKAQKAEETGAEAEKKSSNEEIDLGDGEFSLPQIDDVHIENALLTYRDGESGQERRIVIKTADGRATGNTVNFTFDGLLDGLAMSADISVGAAPRNVPLSEIGRAHV